VFLTVVVDLLGFGIVLPLLPLYAKRYGASAPVVGVLFASFSAMQFLTAPLWGRLSDRVGRRPVILAGLCGSVTAYALFGLADRTPWPLAALFASRIAAGVFGGTISTASAFIADVTTREQRGRGMALIGAAFGVGFTLGPAVGGLAWEHLGASGPGFIAAGLSSLALLFAWTRLPEPERRRERQARRLFDLGAVRAALRTPTVPLILVLGFTATAAFAMFETSLALRAERQFSFDPGDNGWLFSYVGLWLVLSQGLLVRRLMPSVGELRFVVGGTALLAAGILGVGLADAIVVLGAVVPFVVTGFAMVTPSLSSLLSRRTSPDTQGEILGLHQSGLSAARIVGPVAGLALFGAGFRVPYHVGAGIMLGAFLLALRLRSLSATDRA
jgi:MFS family permease